MRIPMAFRELSLRSKLIASYLVISALGGLAISFVGSWIVSKSIMQQAQRTAEHDLLTARAVLNQQLESLGRTVDLAAASMVMLQGASEDSLALRDFLDYLCRESGFDFLALTDPRGKVTLRVPEHSSVGDTVPPTGVVAAALSGTSAAAPEILSADRLQHEHPSLPAKARFQLLATPHAGPPTRSEERSGMVLMASAPVRDSLGRVRGALYGGTLLSRNLAIVDGIWDILYAGEQYRGQAVGTATIFQGDLRIATTVVTADGERALGTRVSEEVRAAVLDRGERWNDRAFVVRDWYFSAYEPIYDYDANIIGMLYVGLLEKQYTALRNRVIVSFLVVATIGFVAIMVISYFIVRSVTRPVAELVSATQDIAAGRFDCRLPPPAPDELGQLTASFSTMLGSLRTMKRDLETWGHTLEVKVQQRTDELVAMQARMAQAERLAALGMLSAGVAHEINNPLGGILALTALALEETADDDPRAPNLKEVVTQAQRCKEIVKGLLDFSRQSEMTPQHVNLDDVISSTLALIEHQASFFNIRVVRHISLEPALVLGDSSQLQQVFLNIIVNAVHAMDEQGTLTITSVRTEDGQVEVSVADTGRGIPPDQVDRVFDPFFTTQAGTGTGLGLAIAYGIIARHEGSITVESEVGRGSTFAVRLPVAPASSEIATMA
ncbi:MAG: cache domain-containing protein [Gemmatimonadales bacterium]|jgi:two-component system NtrC family sensor kinase